MKIAPAKISFINNLYSRYNLIIYTCLVIFAAYLLTPRFYEPNAETWRYWAAARILKETGGFPVFSVGPLYVLYLLLFQWLDFPSSLQIEYIVTHLFCYLALFFMLKRIIPNFLALMLTCAWIPSLATTEGSATVAGIGFIALYIRENLTLKQNQDQNVEYLPNSLLASSLCSLAYLPFVIGHTLWVIINKIINKDLKFKLILSGSLNKKRFFSWVIRATLLMLVIFTLMFPSNRNDHNHMLIDPTYMPIPLNNALNIGFFQIGNCLYVMRTTPESQWFEKDWYFTNKEAFGNAQNFLQALWRKPETILMLFRESMRALVRIPNDFFVGGYFNNSIISAIFIVISFFISIFGIVGVFRKYSFNKLMPFICSITLGTTAVICALMFTAFGKRYFIVLLPVWFLVLFCIEPEFLRFLRFIFKEQNGIFLKNDNRVFFKNQKNMLITFLIILFLGCIFNKTSINFLLHRELPLWLWNSIWTFDFVLLIIGIACLVIFISNIKYSIEGNYRSNFVLMIVISTILVFSTVQYRYGWKKQLTATLNNQGFLSQYKPVGMVTAYPKLSIYLHKNNKILAFENTWIMGFTDVDINKIYDIFSLAPFKDQINATEKFLSELDAIFVSYAWSTKADSVSTQSYLRYYLHVAPFLEKALESGWIEKEVEGYGKIYTKRRNTGL